MRLLDLFCGAGGAAMGYHRAGFEVVGVDIKPQPHYPFEFIQRDAFEYLNDWSADLGDVIHASPPCQRYIRGGLQDTARHPDLLAEIRHDLDAIGAPYVIENVPGAPMRPDFQLCGSMFGLAVRMSVDTDDGVGVNTWRNEIEAAIAHLEPSMATNIEAGAWSSMLPGTLESWSEALGIDWMTASELADAIPPAYTEFIGEQLLALLNAEEVTPQT